MDDIRPIVRKLLAEKEQLRWPSWEGVAAHNEDDFDKLFDWLKKLVAPDGRNDPAADIFTPRDAVLDAVEQELVSYFETRALAGREGLLEWERDYIIGRIGLRLPACLFHAALEADA